jgi:hypothetical protein
MIETDKPVSEQQEELIRGYYSGQVITETECMDTWA